MINHFLIKLEKYLRYEGKIIACRSGSKCLISKRIELESKWARGSVAAKTPDFKRHVSSLEIFEEEFKVIFKMTKYIKSIWVCLTPANSFNNASLDDDFDIFQFLRTKSTDSFKM